MGKIKAGCVVVTEFCRQGDERFTGYINYIDRDEAIRNDATAEYNLYQDYTQKRSEPYRLLKTVQNHTSHRTRTNQSRFYHHLAQLHQSVQ